MLGSIGVTTSHPKTIQSTEVKDLEAIEYDDEDEEFANEIIQKEEKYVKKANEPPPNLAPYVKKLEETNEDSTENSEIPTVFHSPSLNETTLDSEIQKFNVSTKTLSLGRVFYYYWRINGVDKILSVEDIPFKSPEFHFNGIVSKSKFFLDL